MFKKNIIYLESVSITLCCCFFLIGTDMLKFNLFRLLKLNYEYASNSSKETLIYLLTDLKLFLIYSIESMLKSYLILDL